MSDDDDYEYGGYYDSEDDYQEDVADHVVCSSRNKSFQFVVTDSI